MIDWDNPFLAMPIFLIGIALCVFLVIICVCAIDYKLHDFPVEITQDGNVMYRGIMSCVDVASSGDTTTIQIKEGFLCLFPKSVILGRGIEIKSLEEGK